MGTVLQVRDGAIKLPRNLWSEWGDAVVFEPSPDTLIIKKREKPLRKISDLAGRVRSRSMSAREIQKEIEAYRKNA